MKYYLCAYGHTFRISIKCASPEQAAKYCFGVADRVTTLCIGGRNWKYATNKQKQAWQVELAKLHRKQTGNELTRIM